MRRGPARIWYIILFAFVIRIFFVFSVNIFPINKSYHANDSKEYIALAKELVSNGRFFRTGVYENIGRLDTIEIIRTPGYPLFLVPGILLNNIDLVVIALQIILSCFTVYLTYRIALILFNNENAALVGAFLFAIDPMSVFYTIYILTETLFTFLVTLFAYFLLEYLQDRRLKHLIIASLALAAAIFVRPVAYFLPLFLTISAILYFALTYRQNKISFQHIAIFFFLAMGPLFLWQARNYVTTGYSGFSAITDINLYFYNGAAVTAANQGLSYEDLQIEMGLWEIKVYFQHHPEQRTWSEAQRLRYLREEGLKNIKSNLSTYFILHLKWMLRIILDPGNVKYFKLFKLESDKIQFIGLYNNFGIIKTIIFLVKTRPVMFCFYLIFGLLLIVNTFFIMAALFSNRTSLNIQIVAVWAIILYFLIISGSPGDGPRFRLPIMPLLAGFAGCGLSVIWKFFKDHCPAPIKT